MPKKDPDESGWTIEPSLPKARRAARRDPVLDRVVAECLQDGKVRARTFPSKKEAQLTGRRLRAYAIDAGGKVAVTYEDLDGGQVKLYFARKDDGS
jgi:hypothetical protein